MNIIDSHFHIYKSDRAGLMAQGGTSLIGYNGVLEEALSFLNRGKIKKLLGLAVVPISPMRKSAMKKWPEDMTPAQKTELTNELEHTMQTRLTSYNDWLCEKCREDGRIEPVIAADATIEPDYMAAEILSKYERYKIKVLKIHPSVNHLSADDKGYEPIFALAQEKGLTIISHGGISGDDLEGKYCAPGNFQKVLDNFPNLKLVIAHLAYPHIEPLLELAANYPNLYTDISFVLKHTSLTDEELCRIIRKFGPERVLFGSDFPWSDPEKDVDRLLNLKLSNEEQDMLAFQNAERLFAII